jgi:hypothetical protein
MAFGDDDLTAIFSSSGAFTVLGTFDVSGSPLAVYGMFSAGSDANMLYGVEVEATDPSFTCKSSDVATVRNKMTVVISAVTYTVQRVAKSGAPGIATVYLKT